MRWLIPFVCSMFFSPLPGPASAADALTPHLVILVRHAEKATDDPKDPTLSAAGQIRAQALADLLVDSPPVAILVSPLRRTQLTAAPIAAKLGLRPEVVEIVGDAEQYAQSVAARIDALPAGPILVVGHSNTIPPLIAALGARQPEIEDNEYDAVFVLQRWADGRVDLIRSQYGDAAAAATDHEASQ